MKKKIVAIVAAMTMTFTLAACGSSSTAPNASSAAPSEAPEAASEEAASTEAAAETTAETEETASTAAASAELLPGGGSKIIYCITPSTSNVYFKTVQDISTSKGEELGYEVKCFSHDDDAAKQSDLFDQAIADKAAFIVCDNAGADASVEAVQRARDAGIPTFLVDREINKDGVAAAQLVADNAQGAADVAEAFCESMEYTGKYAELLGLESDTNCQVRSDNFHSVIDQYTDMEMVAQQSANWDQTEAYEKTETILQSNPEITGIICGNDTMACGAAAAVKDAGRDDIKIIGVDGSDDAGALIKSGQMVGTALQQIAMITQTAVEEGDAYLNGTAPESEKQLIPCVVITADNVDKLSGFVYSE
ncbi:MAG: D-ribose ABC transporter substrate-binding protein [Lachnospiraceae bacterium]|nr:D-ribose ABC transporter substrate-binding protein [Lachnospiraceae bacterium]